MIISLNAIKQFVDIDVPIDTLTDLISSRLVEIERVIDLGKKYVGIYIVKVIEVDKIDGSDHLSAVLIDDARKNKDIQRNEDGFIQVVCGALNVKQGMFVAWLAPGSVLPETFDSGKLLTIDSREMRGVMSNGMLASAKELALLDEDDGILELDDKNEPGTVFAKIYGLDDYLLDIENKSLTHRPDCFGLIGFAREVSAILGKSFKTPENYLNTNPKFQTKQDDSFNLSVAIDNPEMCDRYQAILMSNFDNTKKTSITLKTYLSRMGIRPINLIVDMTNYLMLLTGQPLHAFDYDKVVALAGKADIHVRAAKDGEELELLDGKTIKLQADDIVIAAGDRAIALAGAMGGLATEVDDDTKNIIIESATFNLYNLRATQMRHGIYSEAITRFTKGQPAAQTAPTLFNVVNRIQYWAEGDCVSEVKDVYPGKTEKITIELDTDNLNDVLGSKFSTSKVVDTLKNVEFSVELDKKKITVSPPYWRTDIHIPEDIIEEIGRINGFDNIEATLPKRNFEAVFVSSFDRFRDILRKKLVCAGANEVLTYSFIHGDMMKKAGLDPENSYKIENSISPELQYYRQSIMPSLLNLVHPNIKQGYDSFALFEFGKAHQKIEGLIDVEKVPFEYDKLAFVVANKNNTTDSPYYLAKKYFDHLTDSFDLDLEYKPIGQQCICPTMYPFEYKRSCEVHDKKSRLLVGMIGEFKKSVTKNFKLPEYCSGFEIFVNNLFDSAGKASDIVVNYKPLSRFPSTDRDICFQVDNDMQYSTLTLSVKKALESVKLDAQFNPIDIYQKKDSKTKNITIRIKLTAHDHTLTGEEVSKTIDSIIQSVTSEIKATII
jgi:phenylalanyl-tRNA synthetase beta chain